MCESKGLSLNPLPRLFWTTKKFALHSGGKRGEPKVSDRLSREGSGGGKKNSTKKVVKHIIFFRNSLREEIKGVGKKKIVTLWNLQHLFGEFRARKSSRLVVHVPADRKMGASPPHKKKVFHRDCQPCVSFPKKKREGFFCSIKQGTHNSPLLACKK